MSRPRKLDGYSRTFVARSYIAGTPCSELAQQYGVTMACVINIAKEYEVEQAMRRLKILEKQARQQVPPPPIQMPEPAPCGTIITKFGQTIRMPFVSIQHPKGD